MKMNFDFSKYDEERESKTDLLPDGEYNFTVFATEVKETKNKKGGYVQMFCKVLDGQHKGKVFQDTFNLWNENQDTVRIAAGKLKLLLRLGGHKNPNGLIADSDELVDLKARASIESYKETGTDGKDHQYNRVKKYKSYEPEAFNGEKQAEQIGAPSNPMATKQTDASAGGSTTTPPWLKGK